MITIDKLSYQSKLRYINAVEKFIYAVSTLLVCVISRSINVALIVVALNTYLIVAKSGVSMHRFLHFMKLPLVFLLLSTLAIIVNFSSSPLDAYAIQVGSIYITSSKASLWFALQLIMTALASVSCLYFLSFTTPMTDILSVLRKLHCPELFIELMLLIYRFIFVLLDTAYHITTSQNARLGNRNFKTSCKSFGGMGSVLLIRAFKRSNRLYDSMEARCYDGKIMILEENYPPRKREIIYICGYEILLIAVAVAAYLL